MNLYSKRVNYSQKLLFQSMSFQQTSQWFAGEPKRQVKTRVKYVDVPVPSPPKIIERDHKEWGNNLKGRGTMVSHKTLNREKKESIGGQNFRGELKPNKDFGLEVMDFFNLEIFNV